MNSIYTVLVMYFVHFGMDGPGRTLHTLSRLLVGSVCKGRHDDLRVGDG